ncbi:homogentisate 1,2-dioxygenase, partial [Sulfolobus sp. C3]
MVFYVKQGELPKKRHTLFMKDGKIIREEVFGTETFFGRYSLLYHLNPPTRVIKLGEWKSFSIKEWEESGYRHHKLSTSKLGNSSDPFIDRKPLLYNDELVLSYAKLESNSPYFYRNADFDEVYYLHTGEAKFESVFGELEIKEGDYLLIPRGTTYTFEIRKPSEFFIIEGKKIEVPKRYRNEYGQLMEGSFYYYRDIRTPTLRTFDE